VYPQLRREKKIRIYGKKNLKMMRRMILNFEIKLKVSPIPAKKEEENMKKRTKDERKKKKWKEDRED
jgi:hypothetical protein